MAHSLLFSTMSTRLPRGKYGNLQSLNEFPVILSSTPSLGINMDSTTVRQSTPRSENG